MWVFLVSRSWNHKNKLRLGILISHYPLELYIRAIFTQRVRERERRKQRKMPRSGLVFHRHRSRRASHEIRHEIYVKRFSHSIFMRVEKKRSARKGTYFTATQDAWFKILILLIFCRISSPLPFREARARLFYAVCAIIALPLFSHPHPPFAMMKFQFLKKLHFDWILKANEGNDQSRRQQQRRDFVSCIMQTGIRTKIHRASDKQTSVYLPSRAHKILKISNHDP